MKNIFLSLLLVLIFASFSLAGTAQSAGGVLEFTETGADEIALSPNVSAEYTDGVNATNVAKQWYVAGTTHTGGNFTYATAANITKIYKLKNNAAGNRFGDMPDSVQSESVWSTSGWDL